jgi:hypothetical protein
MSNGPAKPIIIPTPVVPKHTKLGVGFSKEEIRDSFEHPGRRTDPRRGYQSPAGWLGDLSDARKVIILCSFCRTKFNPKRNKYRKLYVPDSSGKTDGYTANGKCDACKGQTANIGGGTIFISEETWEQVSMDPQEARRNARAAWRQDRSFTKMAAVKADIRHNPLKYGKRRTTFAVNDRRRVK